jgi:hypothetical protein
VIDSHMLMLTTFIIIVAAAEAEVPAIKING